MSQRPVLTDQQTALAQYLAALFAPMREGARVQEPMAALPVATEFGAPAATPGHGGRPEGCAGDRAAAAAATPAIEPGFRGDCLLAEHQLLRLALPMQALAAILPAPEEYARLPGQAAWLRGVVRHRGHNVPVVSAELLAARPADASPPAAGQTAQVVVLGSGRWAVHLDHAAGTRSVTPGDYRLRARRERLPWLAGYLTRGLVSLIDVAELEAWLDVLAHGTDTAETPRIGR